MDDPGSHRVVCVCGPRVGRIFQLDTRARRRVCCCGLRIAASWYGPMVVVVCAALVSCFAIGVTAHHAASIERERFSYGRSRLAADVWIVLEVLARADGGYCGFVVDTEFAAEVDLAGRGSVVR